MRGLLSVLFFYDESNKVNNTRAQMLDSIYHMALKLFCNCFFWREDFAIYTRRCYERHHFKFKIKCLFCSDNNVTKYVNH